MSIMQSFGEKVAAGWADVLRTEGIKSGDIAVDGSSNEMPARCVIGVGWVPENILHDIGVRDAHLLARDTLLRGVTEKKR